ncbi:hypothetical protein Q8A67_012532 [Cirrhinus molitorella]|nr:hypothetical protein Q8A67_012532 [Cirrhinus molitorella]
MKIEEAFRVKQEDPEEQIDLMPLKEECELCLLHSPWFYATVTEDQTITINWAEDLLEIQKGERSLEEYVEEFLSVFDQSS